MYANASTAGHGWASYPVVAEGYLLNTSFPVIPDPEVADYVKRKADDPDRWLRGMRRLRARTVR